jgi:hypothetical protein
MKRPLLALAAFLALALAPHAHAQSSADLKAQMDLLLEWWPGRYDNNEQIVRQSGGGLSPTKTAPFYRLHSIVQKIDMKRLGDTVLYVEEYRDNDPKKIDRIRFYALKIDEAAKAIEITAYTVRDRMSLAGASAEPARLQALGEKDIIPLGPDCRMLVRWVGAQFVGGTEPRRCKVANEPTYVDYQLTVGERFAWQRWVRRSVKDDSITAEGTPGSNFGWVEQTKASMVDCEVLESRDGDMRKTKDLMRISLHDQGGEADIPWPDGRTLTFLIHTRAFTSPTKLEYPLFRIHEKGKMEVPLAYAYALDPSDRYGLNLGWFYIRCQVRQAAP